MLSKQICTTSIDNKYLCNQQKGNACVFFPQAAIQRPSETNNEETAGFTLLRQHQYTYITAYQIQISWHQSK